MSSDLSYRPATDQDYDDLSMFLSFEYYVHRHLDWRSSLDWLGKAPFWIAKAGNELVGCYAAAPEPEDAAWVRLFACSALYSRQKLWQEFFQRSLKQYSPQVNTISALGIENWFSNLMDKSNFVLTQKIIVLEWNKQPLPDTIIPSALSLRPMVKADFEKVLTLDRLCFHPSWQMSLPAIENAFDQAGYATVIEEQENIIGYQITTESLDTAHLARIAINPAYQGQKLGKNILNDLLTHYANLNIRRFTVNTQNDNLSSQALYRKTGFNLTDESYPVYTYRLR